MRTKEKLAQDLEAAGAPQEIVENAHKGIYDDFESPLPFPILSLMNTCERLGLTEIIAKAKNGEYDATREESDHWMETEGRKLLDVRTLRALFEEEPHAKP